jgi:hypothetical protein
MRMNVYPVSWNRMNWPVWDKKGSFNPTAPPRKIWVTCPKAASAIAVESALLRRPARMLEMRLTVVEFGIFCEKRKREW